uniref:hypothetical protein n=1 Tax=Pseudomonas prosekii TaxID=1148509 RepID=UPI0011B28C59|nr:hypothetical protein [Pseudomonas prosekii]
MNLEDFGKSNLRQTKILMLSADYGVVAKMEVSLLCSHQHHSASAELTHHPRRFWIAGVPAGKLISVLHDRCKLLA